MINLVISRIRRGGLNKNLLIANRCLVDTVQRGAQRRDFGSENCLMASSKVKTFAKSANAGDGSVLGNDCLPIGHTNMSLAP